MELGQRVPRVETQRSTQVSDVSDQSGDADLMVNNLVYKQPLSLSLCTNRHYNRLFWQRNDYPNASLQTAVIDWTSGSNYIDTANSYLTFNIQLVTADASVATVNFGSGSASNLIRSILLKSRSGVELERIDRVNFCSRIETIYNTSDDYLRKFGSVEGFGAARDGATDPANVLTASKARFAIPLCRLAPFFKNIKDNLLPPQIASGLHMEIVWEDPRTAFFYKTGTAVQISNYNITELSIMADSCTLTDDTQKTLNMESAKTGLELTYERIHHYGFSQQSGQTNVSVQVQKAVSQAQYAYAMCVPTANILDITADSFKTVVYDTTEWQYRLGAVYFPNQTIKDPDSDAIESYFQSAMCYDKVKHYYAENSISVDDFKNGDGIHTVCFEKNQSLSLSGMPVNNSRVLEFDATFSAVPAAREIMIFLHYSSVAKAFIDNTAVAI
jgi:hypothetical protein